jgi:acetyltransferase-like isoleucine patch superfamily enzyme
VRRKSLPRRLERFLRHRFFRRKRYRPPDLNAERERNIARIARLRSRGVRIGEGCVIHTEHFSSEPYLVDIGDNVGIAPGTHFMTHDGSVFPARRLGPQIFGRISIGDNSFVGMNCLILPGTVVGRDCIIGAGSVVGSTVPDGSVVMGNPARVVMSVKMAEQLPARHRHRLDVSGLPPEERERRIREHFGLL